MNRPKWVVLLLVCIVVVGIGVNSTRYGDFAGVNRLDPEQMTQVDRIVTAYKSQYKYINIALVLDSEVVLTKSYGQNRLRKTDVYASVSKPVTAMIFMQLLESGEIEDLHDDILRYCPEYALVMPERYADNPISFYHLLTHQSGVSHLSDLWEGEKLNLAFRPGSDVMYSSNGYGILGMVMSQLTGMSYSDLVETYIVQPVGAESFETPDIFAAPSGQVHSTIYDMAIFANGVMNGTYVSNEFLQELMFQRYTSNEYGDICLGWFCSDIGSPDMTIFHNGSNGRPRAHLRIKPEKGMAVAITGMNRFEDGAQDFADLSMELIGLLEIIRG